MLFRDDYNGEELAKEAQRRYEEVVEKLRAYPPVPVENLLMKGDVTDLVWAESEVLDKGKD